MKKFYIYSIFVIVLFILSNFESKAQCSLGSVDPTYYMDSQPVTGWCNGGYYSVKIEGLADGVTYTIAYPGYSDSKTYWTDLWQNGQPVTSFTWILGSVYSSLHFTITASSSSCSGVVLDKTITVGTPNIGVNLTSTHPNPNAICQGDGTTLNLTVTGVTGEDATYNWYLNRGEGHPIGIVGCNRPNCNFIGTSFTPTESGEYWVTVVGPCGAEATSEPINVSFIPQAANANLINNVTGNSNVQLRCVGSGTTSYTGWGANATQYKFEVSGGGNSISPAGLQTYNGGNVSATVNWSSAFEGAATVKVTFYGCNGSTSAQSNIMNVNSIPSATLTITGNTAICPNNLDPTTLTLSANSGILDADWFDLYWNQTWVGRKTPIDSEGERMSEVSWNVTQPGTYTAQATGKGCTNLPMNGSPVVNEKEPGRIIVKGFTQSQPTPVESATFNSCGSSNQLTLTVEGSSDYTWYADRSMPDMHNFDEHLVRNVNIQPYQTGVFWVVGKESVCNITQVQSNSVGVGIDTAPNAYLTPSGTLKVPSTSQGRLVSVSSAQYMTYSWFKGSTQIPGAIGSSITVTEDGIYYAKVVSPNGVCEAISPVPLNYIVNKPPLVSVQSQTITLPNRSAVLNANITDDGNAVLTMQWSLLSGPSEIDLLQARSSTLGVNNLLQGQYQFLISVKDDYSDIANSIATVDVVAPPHNYNYIRESSVLVEGKTTEASLEGLSVTEKTVNTNYFDGLSRSVQSVSKQQSPSESDIVLLKTYDEFGRETTNYLPYTSGSNGNFKESPVDEQSVFYQQTPLIAQDVPYSKTVFEPSPLNRVLKQGAAGEVWQPVNANDHTIKKGYGLNQVQDTVVLFTLDSNMRLMGAGYYEPYSLFANKTYDEENNLVVEFIDKQGRTICKKVQSSKPEEALAFASTYYIYDDLGNLVVVLPPEGVEKLKSALNLN